MPTSSNRIARRPCAVALVLLALAGCGAGRRTPEPASSATATSDLDERIARAGSGDLEAQLLLASMYFDGAGVPRDEAEAAKWFARAAERNDPRAQYALAVLATDPAEKARWLGLAAQQGHVGAQRTLGVAYFAGVGIAADANESAR